MSSWPHPVRQVVSMSPKTPIFAAVIGVAIIVAAAAFFLAGSGGSSGLEYDYDDEGMTAEVVGFTGKIETADVPDSVKKDDMTYSVTGIGTKAFKGCESLKSVTIPASVSSIGPQPFLGCTSLESITVAEGNEHYQSVDGVLFDMSGVRLIAYPAGSTAMSYKVPGGTVVIEAGAFDSAALLDNILLDKELVKIESGAFNGCTSLKHISNQSAIYLAEGSDLNGGIAKYAELIVGYVTTTMGEDGSRYIVNVSSKVAQLSAYFGIEEEVVMEPTITYMDEEYILSSIGYRAFQGSDVAKVILSNQVISIGDEAFYGCENLTEFDAADGLQYIGRAAFSACPALASIDLEMGPAYIDDRAFDGSGAVKSLILGSMLQYVGEDAFAELTFMEGELIADPTAENLNDTIWSGKGDGILRHTRMASHDNGFIGTEGQEGADSMSDEITVTITRHKAFVMSKTPATLVMDGVEIGKLKNGESIQYKTTEGRHEFQAKAVSALSGTKFMDLKDGDVIGIKMVVAGWEVTHEKKNRFFVKPARSAAMAEAYIIG